MATGGANRKLWRGKLWLTAGLISLVFAAGVKLLLLGWRMMGENAAYGIAPHSTFSVMAVLLIGLVMVATAWIGPVWILSELFYVGCFYISKMKGGKSGRCESTR